MDASARGWGRMGRPMHGTRLSDQARLQNNQTPKGTGHGWKAAAVLLPKVNRVCASSSACCACSRLRGPVFIQHRWLITITKESEGSGARASQAKGQQAPKKICLQLLAAWPLLLQLPHQLLLRLLSLLSLAFGLPTVLRDRHSSADSCMSAPAIVSG